MTDIVPARYMVELAYADDAISGWVEPAGQTRVFFSGWLELLSLLERPTSSGVEAGGPEGDVAAE